MPATAVGPAIALAERFPLEDRFMRKLIFFALFASACQGAPKVDEVRSSLTRDANPMVPPADLTALVAANSGFATSLYKVLAANGGNVVFAPYGLSFNLAMLRENISATRKSGIDTTLGFSLPDARLDPAFDALDLGLAAITGKTASGSGHPFFSASAIWAATPPLSSSGYLDTLALYYGAGILVGKDPGQAIAAWQATLPGDGPLPFQLAGDADFALVNYIHVDAAWQTSFDPSATHPADFHRADGSVVSASTMSLTSDLSIATTSPRAVELPYDGGGLSMLILVPDDLSAFEAGFGPATVDDALARMSSQRTALTMPKLSFKSSTSVLPAMQSMGLPLDSGHYQVWHSVELRADETGTVASAMTTTSHTPSAVQPSTPFAIDRSFVFVIRDTSNGSILFLGRVVDPTAS
jgi:serpin B